MKKHYRLAIYLAAYDPYKDLFDIFIEQFKKYWPDCPYPLIISNMYFDYDGGNNIIVIHNGDEKDATVRKNKAIEAVDADYYLGMEEDRIFCGKVSTEEVEKILDFMDKENVYYYRCNASIFKKKKQDKYEGYDHYYHIPANEPYGICGSTVIWSKKLLDYRKKHNLENGYVWEAHTLRQASLATEKWVTNSATDDRNLFSIVHCIEKQKWIRKSKKLIQTEGYVIDNKRVTQNLKDTIYMNIKDICKYMPIKYRKVVKSIAKKFGFKFVTDY